MEALNRAASEAMCESGVNAATDITGFGLLGHLTEMAAGSGCAAEIAASSVPALPGALELAEEAAPGGTRSNLDRALDRGVRFDAAISESSRLLLCDAQTSGGLLIAVASDRCDALLQRLSANGVTDARRIGRLTVAAIDGAIRVVG
jgi:selenide,water dikinase